MTFGFRKYYGINTTIMWVQVLGLNFEHCCYVLVIDIECSEVLIFPPASNVYHYLLLLLAADFKLVKQLGVGENVFLPFACSTLFFNLVVILLQA